jgi:hypothetical protein
MASSDLAPDELVELFVGPTVSVVPAGQPKIKRDEVRKAIISALPIDWDDYTTVVEVVDYDENTGGKRVIWGQPVRAADAVIAALQPFLEVPDADGL